MSLRRRRWRGATPARWVLLGLCVVSIAAMFATAVYGNAALACVAGFIGGVLCEALTREFDL